MLNNTGVGPKNMVVFRVVPIWLAEPYPVSVDDLLGRPAIPKGIFEAPPHAVLFPFRILAKGVFHAIIKPNNDLDGELY